MSLTVVVARGDAGERGREVGRALADPIRRSLDFYRGFMERRGLPPSRLADALAPYRAAAEEAFPALVRELDGMAEGAGADPWELFAVNAFEELEPSLGAGAGAAPERCTAFAAAGPEGTILAHNEQWYAGDRGGVAVVAAVPEEGPAFVSPTVAACLPAVGLNAAGVGQAIMSLAALDDRVGVPRVLVSRHSLQAEGPEDAVARATAPGRAGGYGHLFALSGGRVFTVETTSTDHRVLDGRAAHTNHYLAPLLARRAPPPSPGSRARLARLRDLLRERRPASPEEAMEVLRDHGGAGPSICLHADPAEGDEAEAVVFSMVCHVEEGRVWVAPGNPCEEAFTEVGLGETARREVC